MCDGSFRLVRTLLLLLSFLSPAVVVAAQGALTSWDPLAIRQTGTQGTSINVSLRFDYDNASSSTVGYFIFVQDNPDCPKSSSSHSWIPFNLTSGSMTALMPGTTTVSVPLNTTGLTYGTYVTNVCFLAEDPDNPTNVAVPVILKYVTADNIFMDGFE